MCNLRGRDSGRERPTQDARVVPLGGCHGDTQQRVRCSSRARATSRYGLQQVRRQLRQRSARMASAGAMRLQLMEPAAAPRKLGSGGQFGQLAAQLACWLVGWLAGVRGARWWGGAKHELGHWGRA